MKILNIQKLKSQFIWSRLSECFCVLLWNWTPVSRYIFFNILLLLFFGGGGGGGDGFEDFYASLKSVFIYMTVKKWMKNEDGYTTSTDLW